jgi:hypothetical protein
VHAGRRLSNEALRGRPVPRATRSGIRHHPAGRTIALRIFAQDAKILAAQTRTIHTFGEERFVSTEIDILGAQILRLMKRAAAGASGDDDEAYEKEITLRI